LGTGVAVAEKGGDGGRERHQCFVIILGEEKPLSGSISGWICDWNVAKIERGRDRLVIRQSYHIVDGRTGMRLEVNDLGGAEEVYKSSGGPDGVDS